MPSDSKPKNISLLIGDIQNILEEYVNPSFGRFPVGSKNLSNTELSQINVEESHANGILKSKEESEKNLQIEQLQAKNVDLTQENNLLLMQLKILKEDLKNAFGERTEHLKIEAALENRLSRIQGLLPDTFEHGLLEIMDVINSGDSQTITCRYTDFKVKDLSDSEFIFQLVSSSEGVGIWIDPEPGASQFFYPKRVSQEQQRNLYFSYTAHHWNRALAAISGCLHYFQSRPKYFAIPKKLDADKWLGLISKLAEQVACLPVMPRFDAITLKRQQANADYEYIWFEINNLTYEAFSCPKFEIRFSASLVKADVFSRFPKIEIPLVDGIHKPFASWYAESTDDQGDKFEIRFALDNNSFDLKVWNQLSSEDKSILTLLILYFPQILVRLSLDTELIGRQWADWLMLANQTSDVFKTFLTGKSQFAAALKDDGIKGEGAHKSGQVKSFAVRPKNRG